MENHPNPQENIPPQGAGVDLLQHAEAEAGQHEAAYMSPAEEVAWDGIVANYNNTTSANAANAPAGSVHNAAPTLPFPSPGHNVPPAANMPPAPPVPVVPPTPARQAAPPANGSQGGGNNPFEMNKLHMHVGDASRDVVSAARDYSAEQNNRETTQRGFRGFLRKIWHGNYAKEYLQLSRQRQARNDMLNGQNGQPLEATEVNFYQMRGGDSAAAKADAIARVAETVLTDPSLLSDDERTVTLTTIDRDANGNPIRDPQTGEIQRTENIPGGRALEDALKAAVRNYATTPQMSVDDLREAANRAVNAFARGRRAEDRNLGLSMAHYVEKAAEHARFAWNHVNGIAGAAEANQKLKEALEQTAISHTEMRVGVGGDHVGAAERIMDKLHKWGITSVLGETVVAGAVAGVFIATKLGRGSLEKALIVGGASMGVNGIIGAAREFARLGKERRSFAREYASGMRQPGETAGGTRRERHIEASMYNMASAEELRTNLEGVSTLYANLTADPNNLQAVTVDQLRQAISTVAAARVRWQMTNAGQNLIRYSSPDNVSAEKGRLMVELANARRNLSRILSNPNLASDAVLLGAGVQAPAAPNAPANLQTTPTRDLDTALRGYEGRVSGYLEGDIRAKDRAFFWYKVRRSGWVGARNMVISGVVAEGAREIAAAFDSNVQGAFERPNGQSRETLLARAVNDVRERIDGAKAMHLTPVNSHAAVEVPNGYQLTHTDGKWELIGHDHKVIDGNVTFAHDGQLSEQTQEALKKQGFDFSAQAQTVTHNVPSHTGPSMSPQEYINAHQAQFTHVHRTWDNNNTPTIFDKNEQGLELGGLKGTGIDKNGNFVFDLKEMTAGGSYNGNVHDNVQELIRQGKAGMQLSVTDGTQSHVILVHANADGIVTFNKDDVAGALSNVNGHLKVTGAYAEAVAIGSKTADGVQNVHVLATVVGSNSVHSIPDVVAGGVTHSKLMVTALIPPRGPVEIPVGPAVYARRGVGYAERNTGQQQSPPVPPPTPPANQRPMPPTLPFPQVPGNQPPVPPTPPVVPPVVPPQGGQNPPGGPQPPQGPPTGQPPQPQPTGNFPPPPVPPLPPMPGGQQPTGQQPPQPPPAPMVPPAPGGPASSGNFPAPPSPASRIGNVPPPVGVPGGQGQPPVGMPPVPPLPVPPTGPNASDPLEQLFAAPPLTDEKNGSNVQTPEGEARVTGFSDPDGVLDVAREAGRGADIRWEIDADGVLRPTLVDGGSGEPGSENLPFRGMPEGYDNPEVQNRALDYLRNRGGIDLDAEAYQVAIRNARANNDVAAAEVLSIASNAPDIYDRYALVDRFTGRANVVLAEGAHRIELNCGVAEWRSKGEDRRFSSLSHGVIGVFDGMGGGVGVDPRLAGKPSDQQDAIMHSNARTAVEAAVSTVRGVFGKTYSSTGRSATELREELRDTLQAAANAVAERAPYGGAAATLVHVLPTGEVVWASAGDTRLYLLREGATEAEQVSRDEGVRNVLHNGLFLGGIVMQTGQFKYQPGDRLIVVSDGITGDREPDLLSDKEIADACAGRSAAEAAMNLVKVARKYDDRTAFVVDLRQPAELETNPLPFAGVSERFADNQELQQQAAQMIQTAVHARGSDNVDDLASYPNDVRDAFYQDLAIEAGRTTEAGGADNPELAALLMELRQKPELTANVEHEGLFLPDSEAADGGTGVGNEQRSVADFPENYGGEAFGRLSDSDQRLVVAALRSQIDVWSRLPSMQEDIQKYGQEALVRAVVAQQVVDTFRKNERDDLADAVQELADRYGPELLPYAVNPELQQPPEIADRIRAIQQGANTAGGANAAGESTTTDDGGQAAQGGDGQQTSGQGSPRRATRGGSATARLVTTDEPDPLQQPNGTAEQDGSDSVVQENVETGEDAGGDEPAANSESGSTIREDRRGEPSPFQGDIPAEYADRGNAFQLRAARYVQTALDGFTPEFIPRTGELTAESRNALYDRAMEAAAGAREDSTMQNFINDFLRNHPDATSALDPQGSRTRSGSASASSTSDQDEPVNWQTPAQTNNQDDSQQTGNQVPRTRHGTAHVVVPPAEPDSPQELDTPIALDGETEQATEGRDQGQGDGSAAEQGTAESDTSAELGGNRLAADVAELPFPNLPESAGEDRNNPQLQQDARDAVHSVFQQLAHEGDIRDRAFRFEILSNLLENEPDEDVKGIISVLSQHPEMTDGIVEEVLSQASENGE